MVHPLDTIVNNTRYHNGNEAYMTGKHTTVQYQLRLPDELREIIRSSAKAHNRSMNSDIVARLEQSFAKEEGEDMMYFDMTEGWLEKNNIKPNDFAKAIKGMIDFHQKMDEDNKKP